MLDDYLKANLAVWDEAVGLHVGSELYDVAGFKAGRTALSAIELDELGPLVGEGTRLLHLQCHFGLDTLSWARRGAEVTGVDFSGEGIRTARALADEVGLASRATFVQSDVESLPDKLAGQFDVVFTSWGALIWLADLERWADVITHFLRPGGVFYIAEFHPYAFLLADDATPDALRIGYPYFMYGVPQRFDEDGDYADPDAKVQNTVTFEWLHGFSEIVDPLLRRGLRLDFLHELPYTIPGLAFTFLEKDDRGMLRVKGHHEDFPLTFTLKMTREERIPGGAEQTPGARARLLGDQDLLAILEEAIADERAAQEKYRRGLERCADPAACEVFEQLLREEQAHERVLEARYVEVKKRIGLSGAGRD